MKKTTIFLFLAPVFSLIFSICLSYYLIIHWRYQGPEVYFEVNPGEGFAHINYRLYKTGLISSAKIFYHYVKLHDQLSKFKVGVFKIHSDLNMLEVLQTLTEGPSILAKVTIPEGKNIFEIGKLLQQASITNYEEFIAAAREREFLQSLGLNHPSVESVEGHLYPETYYLSPHSSPKIIIRRMVDEHRKRVATLDFSLTDLTPFQVITLASIVEKETGAASERPLIAGVFYNRLKKKMRLQSDPTTIYGIYETFKGNLSRHHLTEQTPYNTYAIPALPIGPIANPGIEAIKAVLQPAKNDFLYFVSRNDGTHVFTATYQDHLEAVRVYQQTRRNREGKSWRDLKQ